MIVKIRAHKIRLETQTRAITKWKVRESVKAEMRRFISDLGLGKVNKGHQISEGRRVKYINTLKIPLEFFNKNTEEITERDVEDFERALSGNQIKSKLLKRDYAHATKIDIRKLLKVYLRWRLGAAEAVRLAGWLDTREREKTPDFLKQQEIEALFRRCRTAEQRFLIAVLFDSGARAEEFLNLRVEDFQLPEGKGNFVKIALREEFSKTKGRTISLYWRHTLDAVQVYLSERIAQGLQSSDPVYEGTYDAMRHFLRRLGQTVLNKPVRPHLFRHSSATYYAAKLNRQELCYRYGWKFSSNMPDVYISRAGFENKELDQKFTATELSTVKDQLALVEQGAKIKEDRIAVLEKSLANLQSKFAQVAEVLKLNPSIADVEAALRRKRGQAAAIS